MNTAIQQGVYRHYKGGEYTVIGVARHSETQESLVVYQSTSNDLWVRPLAMFVEHVQVDGMSVPRFTYIKGGDNTNTKQS